MPGSEATKNPEHHHLDPQAEHAHLLFREIWSEIEQERGGAQQMRFPREIIWLNGAPGSGKGTNTPFIMRERGITVPPLVMSDLLNAPDFKRIKDQGNLIGDREVVRLLLRRLLAPEFRDGVIVDGFPRTRVQVECLKEFHERLLALRQQFARGPQADDFPKPMFRIVVLFVEERESIERQLRRGRQVIAHNQRVRDTGVGDLLEERTTDVNEEAARKRYRIFREQAMEALQGLKKHFHYHLINAQGDLGAVEANIVREFQYQSSLELDEDTLDSINHIALASDLLVHARQNLVRRLDGYQRDHTPLFKQVIYVIEQEFMPVLHLHAVSGRCDVFTENPIFSQALAMHMLLDVFSERGYHVSATTSVREVPYHLDPNTNEIRCRRIPVYRFQFRFQPSVIRRGH